MHAYHLLLFSNHAASGSLVSFLPSSFLRCDEQWPSRGESKENNGRRRKEGRKEGENDRRNQSEKNEKGCLQRARRAASEEAGERASEVGITGAELRSPPDGRTGTANDVRAMLVG